MNIDTEAAAERAVGEYYGNIEVGEILEGSSGARAVVQRRRIITDRIGQYRGTFFIPKPQGDDVTTMPIGLNGSQSTNPRWATGTRTMRFTTNEDDSRTHQVQLLLLHKLNMLLVDRLTQFKRISFQLETQNL